MASSTNPLSGHRPQTDVRAHPVAGSIFLLFGGALVAAGAFGRWSIDIPGPLPASIVIPFVLWQLAVWAILFGFFFLRSRGRAKPRASRFTL